MTDTDHTRRAQDTRLQQLEARTYHIDGEVAALKTQMGGVVDSLSRIETNLLNKQPVWNTGSVVAALSLVATIVVGGGAYVQSQIGHVIDDVKELEAKSVTFEEFRHQAHYEVGEQRVAMRHMEEWKTHFDELMHKRDDRINEIENKQHTHMGRQDHAKDIE